MRARCFCLNTCRRTHDAGLFVYYTLPPRYDTADVTLMPLLLLKIIFARAALCAMRRHEAARYAYAMRAAVAISNI